MEFNDVFDFEWLNHIEDIYTNAVTKEPEMIIEYLPYPVRLSTSPYTGYIVTIKDIDTKEKISFNCDKMDIEPEHLEQTHFELRKRFAITKGDGVYFARKNVKITSITVPKEIYKKLIKQFNYEVWNYEKLKRKNNSNIS